MGTYTIRELTGSALENALEYLRDRFSPEEDIEGLMAAAEDFNLVFDEEGNETEEFSEETMQNGLKALITGAFDPEEICWENFGVSTYQEAGVMTYDKGLVITLPDGTEYQLTIIRSR